MYAEEIGSILAKGDILELVVTKHNGAACFNPQFFKADHILDGYDYLNFRSIRIFRLEANPDLEQGEVWRVKVTKVEVSSPPKKTADSRRYIYIYVRPKERVLERRKYYDRYTGIFTEETWCGSRLRSSKQILARVKPEKYRKGEKVIVVEKIVAADGNILSFAEKMQMPKEIYFEGLKSLFGRNLKPQTLEAAFNKLPMYTI